MKKSQITFDKKHDVTTNILVDGEVVGYIARRTAYGKTFRRVMLNYNGELHYVGQHQNQNTTKEMVIDKLESLNN